MTARVDHKEFLSAYVAEVDEQLRMANTKLLELEGFARRGDSNPRLVRDLFRALHTVKGLSSMVGVEPAVAISHRLESVLRAAVDAGGRLPLDWFDVLLKAIQAIEYRVQELADGKSPSLAPPSLLASLEALETGGAPLPVERLALDPALLAKLAPFELDVLERSPREGRRAVRIDFSPSPQKAERGLTINSIRERLAPIADVVKVLPISVPPTPEAPGALMFAILLTTTSSDRELAVAVGDDSAVIHCLTSPGELPPEPVRSVAVEMEEDEPLVDGIVRQQSVVRVQVGRLDEAMECLSSLIVTRSRLARAIGDLAARGVGTRELTEVMRDNTRQLRDLRSAILRVRMVRVAEVLDRLPLIVRGLRRDAGKDVDLLLETGDAELDKAVAEHLFPALVHLVRNAVDHAIESSEERARKGKPRAGVVQIICSTESSTRLELKIIDDGRGIDRDKLARRLHREIPEGDAALLEILCRPGLSTRDQATTTSGRGMGMDIVKRIVVGQLGGELSSTPGQGTTFSIKVPLTVMIIDAFSIECSGHRFVVPVSMVEEVLEVEREKISYGPSAGGRARDDETGVLERRGEAVPFIPLASALHLTGERRFPRQALLVRRAGEPIAFGVDRVATQLEAVVRPLTDTLVVSPGVSGATDLGDGKPTLVLDLLALGAKLGSLDSRAA